MDITERKQAELDERIKSEKRFRALAEAAPLGMHFYCLEDNGRLVFTGANPAADAILGVDNSVFIGKTIEEAFPASIYTKAPEKFREVVITGKTWETEQIDYDWEGIKGAFRVVAFKTEPGRMAVIFNDITEKKQAQETIRLNEARLEGLLRINEFSAKSTQELLDFALNEVIVLTQSKTGYIFFYDEIKKELTLNTWSRDVTQKCKVTGSQNTYQLDKTGIWGEAVRQAKPIMVNDYAAPNPFKKGLPEGHLPLHRFLTIPVFSQGRIVAVVGVANKETTYNSSDERQLTLMMDAVWKITQRKKAEEEKEELQVRLQQAQKMEAIGALAGGIAHDFNNMMGVILGQVELAMPGISPNGPIHRTLKEIEKAARRSSELTRQLLAFARKQTVAPRVLDLNDTMSAMLSMLQRLIGEDIDLLWKPAKGIWPVMIDPSQIDQVLANLCVNARDAINGVGRLTIETENAIFDEAYCSLHTGYLPGPYVMLAVSDNGQG
ncbi:MAG: GAF domain-containing protein, partial [Desulfobacula sp.]